MSLREIVLEGAQGNATTINVNLVQKQIITPVAPATSTNLTPGQLVNGLCYYGGATSGVISVHFPTVESLNEYFGNNDIENISFEISFMCRQPNLCAWDVYLPTNFVTATGQNVFAMSSFSNYYKFLIRYTNGQYVLYAYNFVPA